MRKFFIIYYALFLVSLNLYSQNNQQNHETLADTSLNSLKVKLRGVKFIDMNYTKAQEDIIINNATSNDVQVLMAFIDYCNDDLGISVIVTEEQRLQSYQLGKSLCDYAYAGYEIGAFNSQLIAVGNYPLSFSFTFCDNSSYIIKTVVNVNGLTNYRKKFRAEFRKKLLIEKGYDVTKRLPVQTNAIVLNERDFENYLNDTIPKYKVEGIYELFSTDNNTPKYRLGIYNMFDTLKVIYFSGAYFTDDWKEGELKGILMKTKSENDFLGIIYNMIKTPTNASLSFINENSFELRLNTPKGIDKYVRTK
jgi:hypothetical protein